MKKLLKAVLWLVVAVVVLVGAAAVLVPMLVDPEDVKQVAVEKAKEFTGRDLAIKGDVKMSVFPWLGVDIGPTSLGNAAGFSAPVFASTQRVQVRVKLMPLLERRLEMDTVTLQGLVLNLERNAKGGANWEFDIKPSADAPAPGGGGGGQAVALASLGGVSVENAAVSFKDAQAGQQIALKNIDLKTGKVTLGEPVDVTGGTDLNLSNPAISGRVDLAAKVSVAGNTITANGAEIKADLSGAGLPGGKLQATVTADVSADNAKQSATLNNLKVALTEFTLTNPAASGRVDISANVAFAGQTLSAKGAQIKADLEGEGLPGGKLQATVNADLSVDNAKHVAAVQNLKVVLADLSATGNVQASGLNGKPAFKGKLDVAGFNLRELLETLGQTLPPMADPKTLTSLKVSTGIAGDAGQLALTPLSIKLDDTQLSGRFSVGDFGAAMPALAFDLKADKLDADRYLPPRAEGDSKAAATPGAAAAGTSSLPLEQLRALNIDGRVALGALKLSGLSMSDMLAVIKAKGGSINAAPLKARLYKGSYAGNIGIDARGDVAKFRVDEQLKGVQIGPLLKDLSGSQQLEGNANLSLKATTSGNSPDQLKQGLNGAGSFRFTDGALNGVNIAAMIREAKARLGGGAAATAKAPQKTDFSELGGTFKITKGVVDNQDFAAKSPLLRLKGKGTANLVSEALDYRLTASVVATAKGQGGKDLTDLAGLDIPVKIGGTFSEPSYGLDEEALVKALATTKAKELVGKGTEEVKKAVEDKVKDAVGGGALGEITKSLGGAAGSAAGGASGGGSSGGADPASQAGKALKNLLGN